MANLPLPIAAAAVVAVLLHCLLRYPASGSLLLVTGTARFALPVEGRFDLSLTAGTRIGSFWIALFFSDRPNSQFLVVKDQIPEPQWRRLCLILREGV